MEQAAEPATTRSTAQASQPATAAQATASGDSIATASTDSQPGSATAWHEEWRGEAEAEQWEVEDRGTSAPGSCPSLPDATGGLSDLDKARTS